MTTFISSCFSLFHRCFIWVTVAIGGSFATTFSTQAQELIPLQESQKLLNQVNQIRFLSKDIRYDSSKQNRVDEYATSKKLVKSYRHSLQGPEIICRGNDYNTFIEQWRMSPKHRRLIKSRRYKSMCARIVRYKGEYFGVIQFY